MVADLEAGLNDLVWARPGPDDMVVAVAEPSAKSVEIARRACRLAEEMGVTRIIGVSNRTVSDVDAKRIGEELGVEMVTIPEDRAIEDADHLGVAAMDADPSSPAMVAVGELAQLVTR